MKHTIKLYLETADIARLKQKANQSGFNGKGSISHYIVKIARERICFVSSEVVELLKEINKIKGS